MRTYFAPPVMVFANLNGSGALETALNLLDQHLRTAIGKRTVRPYTLSSILSALGHFDPSQAVTIQGLCFLWITEILDSGYTAEDRYQMVGTAVELAWKHLQPPYAVQHAWVLPLLGFLQLSEEVHSTDSQSAPGALALRILSHSSEGSDFDPKLLPILTSTLLPTHPLQSRRSALMVFHRFISGGRFPSQTENLSHKDRARFLCAVGDPFQSNPDISHQDGQRMVTNEYEPMKAAVTLIKFASWGLWRDHLRSSNFTSCEEIVSTVEGKESALESMPNVGQSWQILFHTPGEIIAAIERLEELQCPNTAELVFMWAWTSGVVDPVDHDAWRQIGNKTLTFYRAHGVGRLKTLSRRIMDDFHIHYRQNPRCRVEGVRLPVRIPTDVGRIICDREEGYCNDWPLARVCQLRRLYQLFGFDPVTWEEMGGAEKVDEGVDVSLGQPLGPAHLMDCPCDYP
jgi:hypothetical protein